MPARPRAASARHGGDEIGPLTDDGDLGDPAAPQGDGGEGVREGARRLVDHGADELEDAVGVVGVARARRSARRGGRGRRRRSSWPPAWRCRTGPSGGRRAPRRPPASCTRRRGRDPRSGRGGRRRRSLASAIHSASPVASARRVKASTSAAWSAARASWRARGSPSACHERCQRPSAPRSSASRKRPASAAAVDPRRLIEQRAGLGQRGHHQRVPLGQHLVVESRAQPLLAGREEPSAERLDRRRPRPVAPRVQPVGDRAALEVARRR